MWSSTQSSAILGSASSPADQAKISVQRPRCCSYENDVHFAMTIWANFTGTLSSTSSPQPQILSTSGHLVFPHSLAPNFHYCVHQFPICNLHICPKSLNIVSLPS